MVINRKSLCASALAGVLAANAAWALDLKTLREADDDMDLAYEGRTVDQLDEMELVNQAGAKIGDVEKVLINDQNRIVALVVELDPEMDDGPDRRVVVDVDELSLPGPDSKNFITRYTQTQLMDLPLWPGD